MFLFVIFVVALLGLALLYWYLRDYSRAGALRRPVGDKVVVDKEKYIPILRNALIAILKEELGANQAQFDALCDTLSLTLTLENRSLLSALIKDFEVFDPANAALQHVDVSEQQRQEAEKRFLNNFMTMMKKANFKLLTREEREFAEAEQYLLHIPVTSEWEKIDNEMMPQFYASSAGSKHQEADTASVCQQVVVWRRGVGIDQTTGLLLSEKIDVLLTKWFEAFAHKVCSTKYWQQLTGDAPPPPPDAPEPIGADVEAVSRVSLNDMPLTWNFLSKPVTIQEPTFKQVVAMFRYSDAAADGAKAECERTKASIHIKTFRDIPMADLDIVFPAKKILFKTVDFIRLAVTGILGLYFALDQLVAIFSDDAEVQVGAIAACIGLLALAMRTYWAIQWSVDVYKTVLAETLYDKATDSHRGVILFLIEALEAQELKEALIAYTFALKAAAPVTETDLDSMCEQFVDNEVQSARGSATLKPTGIEGETKPPSSLPTINFEVEDAIDKLQRFGMAKVTGATGSRIVEAFPIDEALQNLKDANKKSV